MKKNYVRRNFLKNSLMASGGLVLFPSFSGLANTATNTAINESTGAACDIRNSIFGRQLQIIGQIFDATGKIPVSNALIEFWHLSPNSTQMGHRGSLHTDEKGRYRIKTDWPNREKASMAKVFFKIKNGASKATTELLFNDFGAHITSKHWEMNHQLGDAKLFPKTETFLGKTTINFNMSINPKILSAWNHY